MLTLSEDTHDDIRPDKLRNGQWGKVTASGEYPEDFIGAPCQRVEGDLHIHDRKLPTVISNEAARHESTMRVRVVKNGSTLKIDKNE